MNEYLKNARTNSGKTIEEISKHLKIKKEYLLALEENDFQKMPSRVYVKGYLKLYKDYLGIKQDIETNIISKDIVGRDQSNIIDKKYSLIILTMSIIILLLTIIFYNKNDL
jgi:cytoskeletal protein RodZ